VELTVQSIPVEGFDKPVVAVQRIDHRWRVFMGAGDQHELGTLVEQRHGTGAE